ncbi:MCM DNA helicase complex subunit, partial [Coemansia spiralis]
SDRRKRQADLLSDDDPDGSRIPATPGGGMIFGSSSPVRAPGPAHDPTLPPSSPPPFSPFPGFGQGDDDDDDGLEDAGLGADDLPGQLDEAAQRDDEGEMLALDDEEDEEGEDLFGPGMERDYRRSERLDQYEGELLDDTEYGVMDARERARVEARMRRRDLEEGRSVKSRIPLAFMQDFDDDEARVARRAESKHAHLMDMALEVADEERAMTMDDLKDMKGRSVAAWVSESGPRQTIAREFRRFLLSYVDDKGASVYGERIRQLG